MVVNLSDMQWEELEESPNGIYRFNDVGVVDLSYDELCGIREIERAMICDVLKYWKEGICTSKYIDVSTILVNYDTTNLFSVKELTLVVKLSVYSKKKGKSPSQNDCNRISVNLHNTFLHDIFVSALHDGSLKGKDIAKDYMGYSRCWELPMRLGIEMRLGSLGVVEDICYTRN